MPGIPPELTFLAYLVVMRGDQARVVEGFASWLASQGWTVRTEVDSVDVVADKEGHRLAEAKDATTAGPVESSTTTPS